MKIVQWVDPYTNESLTETEKKIIQVLHVMHYENNS